MSIGTYRLSRQEALDALWDAGWPLHMLDLMVAIGAAESSLWKDVVGPKNSDGTEDLSWLQVNSRYTVEGPHPVGARPGSFSRSRLLADPLYAAQCALQIFRAQGVNAWYGFTNGNYRKFMPPHLGGPSIGIGTGAWFFVEDIQERLNGAGYRDMNGNPLVEDGIFGKRTQFAVISWQKAHPLPTDGLVRPADSVRLIP